MILRNPCKKCLVGPCCRETCDEKDYHNHLIEYIKDGIKNAPDAILEFLGLSTLIVVELFLVLLIVGLLFISVSLLIS